MHCSLKLLWFSVLPFCFLNFRAIFTHIFIKDCRGSIFIRRSVFSVNLRETYKGRTIPSTRQGETNGASLVYKYLSKRALRTSMTQFTNAWLLSHSESRAFWISTKSCRKDGNEAEHFSSVFQMASFFRIWITNTTFWENQSKRVAINPSQIFVYMCAFRPLVLQELLDKILSAIFGRFGWNSKTKNLQVLQGKFWRENFEMYFHVDCVFIQRKKWREKKQLRRI